MAQEEDVLGSLGLGVEYVPYRVELVHPETGNPLIDEDGVQAFVEIDGYNSDAGEKIRKATARRMQLQRKGGREAPIDLDKARDENADNLSILTRAWHLVNLQGKAIPADQFPCTAGNARAIFRRKDTAWMAEQVGAALLEQSNFIKT